MELSTPNLKAMKTTITLLFLPFLLLGQLPLQYENNIHNIAFTMDVTMDYLRTGQMDEFENVNGSVQVSVTVQVYFEKISSEQMLSKFTPSHRMDKKFPQHLVTYSLAGLHPVNAERLRFNERLDDLLALNDPIYPKEDTLFNWLHPVRYKQNQLSELKVLPAGFGPSIRL